MITTSMGLYLILYRIGNNSVDCKIFSFEAIHLAFRLSFFFISGPMISYLFLMFNVYSLFGFEEKYMAVGFVDLSRQIYRS